MPRKKAHPTGVCAECGKDLSANVHASRIYCLSCRYKRRRNQDRASRAKAQAALEKNRPIKQCKNCEIQLPVDAHKRRIRFCSTCFQLRRKNLRRHCAARHRAQGNKSTSLKWKTRILIRLKQLIGCAHCGYNANPAALQWHHIKARRDDIVPVRSWDWLFEEMNNCIVLCANCHRIHHAAQKGPIV
jgi:hypothetical protein